MNNAQVFVYPESHALLLNDTNHIADSPFEQISGSAEALTKETRARHIFFLNRISGMLKKYAS